MAARQVSLFGIRVHDLSLDEAVDLLIALAGDNRPHYVVTPNAHHVVQIRRDAHLHQIYNSADMVLADGMSLIWASRLLGAPLRARVAGSDLFPRMCGAAAERGYRVFLLGGGPTVARTAAENLCRTYPRLQVVGVYSPPYGFESDPQENAQIIRMIRESHPHILFVALGFPKQELWISRYARECAVPLSIGVGAAFDFIAGIRRRAPVWMQRAGLEWLHRLLQEPRRLWHRYLVLGPQFVCLTFAELLRTRKKALLKKECSNEKTAGADPGEIPTSRRGQDR